MEKTFKTVDKTQAIYISGPISSLEKLGEDWRQNFNSAEANLRRQGFREIHNPASIAVGVNAACSALGRRAVYADYMKADLAILLKCKTILMLRGWEGSSGASLEYQIAAACGMDVVYER